MSKTTITGRKADTPVRRILVVFDVTGGSLHSLETAAGLAAGLKAELLGLFIEDERLTRLAELPCTGAVDSFSSVRELDAVQMRRRVRLRSARARRALEAAARSAMVRYSFRTLGAPPDSSLAGLGEGDLLMVHGRGWEGEIISGPSMVLYGRWDARTPVTVLYDGSEGARRALEVASALAKAVSARLIVAMDPSVRALPGRVLGEGEVEVRRLRSPAFGAEGLLVVAGKGGVSALAGRGSRAVLLVR